MNYIQAIADKTAISLSIICTIHCLAMPFLAAMLPAIAALNLEDEAFHLWMLIAVIPTGLFALTLGCRKHRNYRVLILGITGLSVLIASAWLGHDLLGETGEKITTVLGACLVAAGHILNYRLCQRNQCECHS